MDERKYYVFCEDNCKFEAMTKEQIIAAIAEATGKTPTNIDDAFITKIQEQNAKGNLKFWVGTTAEYNALEVKEECVLYLLTDDEIADTIEVYLQETDKLKSAVDVLTAKPMALIATGSYVGDGIPRIRTITCGFKPKVFIVYELDILKWALDSVASSSSHRLVEPSFANHLIWTENLTDYKLEYNGSSYVDYYASFQTTDSSFSFSNYCKYPTSEDIYKYELWLNSKGKQYYWIAIG